MARAGRKRKIDPSAQRPGETHLQWQARLAAQRDFEASAKQPPVTPEAARHGQYEQGYTEVDGARRAVLINRGGSTVQRWLNAAPDDVLGSDFLSLPQAIRQAMATAAVQMRRFKAAGV